MGDSINCREAHARLHDYLKQELTPELAEEVRAHLEKCRPCFKEARFEQSFLVMLATTSRKTSCPGKLREKILTALRAEMERG
jgi:anti-sigma factor (TIGR02949 family)